jgi:hypothetical protein
VSLLVAASAEQAASGSRARLPADQFNLELESRSLSVKLLHLLSKFRHCFTGAGNANHLPDVLNEPLQAILGAEPLVIVLPVDGITYVLF